METPFYITLKNRGLVTISGPDRHGFIQGLITNDINLLKTQPCVYACLLSAQGKFLHDFFITEKDETLYLECESGARTEDLLKKLSTYKLRAKIELNAKNNVDVFVILDPLPVGLCPPFPLPEGRGIKGEGDLYPDPRHETLGHRSLTKPSLAEQPFDIWDERRIRLAIPDGSRDLIVGNSTMDEARMDQINAISYDKGCYVGQELTARMHYRGLGKKHLQMVEIDKLPEGAELRSRCGNIGLALTRHPGS